DAHSDALIGIGTAPLDDPIFRAARFEQLGEDRLEGSVTTDIAGRKEAHAVRLDSEASSSIKKARLHRKVATVILFESNGGQTHGTQATLPEIRLAVAEPDIDIGNIEAVLDTLSSNCYYLEAYGTSYRFGLQIQLPKIHADRKASVPKLEIDECLKSAIIKVFNEGNIIKPVFFPEKSGDIQDNPALALIVLSPDHRRLDSATMDLVESMTKDHGSSARTYKSALIWSMVDNDASLTSEARNALAWEKIHDESEQLHLNERQNREVNEKIGKAKRDLREAVWRSYKNLALLGKDNKISLIDLGLIHSSAAKTLVDLYLMQLRQKAIITSSISPNYLVKNWPPAFREWPTKSVRDAFFASPQFPRLLSPDAVRECISKGVSNGIFAYISKSRDGKYEPVYSKTGLLQDEVEISDEWFIVVEPIPTPGPDTIVIFSSQTAVQPGDEVQFTAKGLGKQGQEIKIDKLSWSATGGTINADGVYKAGPNEGAFVVTANAGEVQGSGSISIVREGGRPPKRIVISPQDANIGRNEIQTFTAKGFDEDDHEVPLNDIRWSAIGGTVDDNGVFLSGQEEGIFRVTATVGDANGLATIRVLKRNSHWEGEIPHQKWTQFYNRILSKFAVRKGLKLAVAVDISDATKEEVEEMRTALRELGLGDDVDIV
ncbi:MAG: AAA family ATPase, partial [Methanothrix sp.]|nr:AAA family ATPase [Methanothrix sp.]